MMSAEPWAGIADRAERAQKIVRELAESFPTWQDAHGWDECEFCRKRIPYGVIGQRQVGTKCRACGDKGHYPVGSLCFCSEERVPNMEPIRGVFQDPALHDESCIWRLARELVAEWDKEVT